jgi:hypothetical protein
MRKLDAVRPAHRGPVGGVLLLYRFASQTRGRWSLATLCVGARILQSNRPLPLSGHGRVSFAQQFAKICNFLGRHQVAAIFVDCAGRSFATSSLGVGVPVMRVLVVSALAATLVGCSSPPPQQMPVHTAAKVKIMAEMKKGPGHHKRIGGKTRTATNAKVELHSAGPDDRSAAERVKGIISAKLGNPASIKFPDIAPGKAVDSFCGVIEVKGASGDGTEMPFVYLVQGNELYIINGSDDSRAIHQVCDRQ